MKKLLTVKEIAAQAGVSVGTVSHVLNNPSKVRDERRKRVEDVMHKLGYQPSQLARGLRKKSTDLLGIIIPDIANPFFPNVVRGAEDIAYREGFRIILCNADNNPIKERTYFNDLKSFRPAGIMVIPSVESMLQKELIADMLPVVFVDRSPAWWAGDMVVADNEEGGYQVGRYLIRMGHRRIAAIGGPAQVSTSRERIRGFERALKDAGLALPADYIQEAAFNAEGGFGATVRLLELDKRPTAIFAASDLLASGALGAARKMGLECPKDVSIVGFDDLEFASLVNPALTTVYQPSYQMGVEACGLLLDRIRGGGGAAQRRVLKTELRIRSSVRLVDRPGDRKAKSIRSEKLQKQAKKHEKEG